MGDDQAPSSPKKKKVEISADKCIRCMCSGGKKDTTVPTLTTLKKVLGYVKERYDYEDPTVTEFWERISDHDPESLVAKNCFYHRRCYADIGNVDKRDMAKERYSRSISEKSVEITRRKSGRPKISSNQREQEVAENRKGVRERSLRSSHPTYDRNACIICQSPEGILHKVETTLTGHTIFECASLLKDKSLEIRLNSVSNPADAVANDVMYHLRCYIYLKRDAGKEDSENIQNLVDTAQIIADIEIINLVETKISLGLILNNNMIHTTYKNMLLENGMQPETIRADYKKYLKRLISENVTDVKFVKGYRVNEPMNVCSSRTESRAMDIAIMQNQVDEFNLLFKASKLLRKELSSNPKWVFKGSFDDFVHPELLTTFLRWVLLGPNLSVEGEKRTQKIENTVSVATQVLMQSFKTKCQSSYSGHSFHNTVETPLNVGIGLPLHHKTRSKGIVVCTYHLESTLPNKYILLLTTRT